MALALSELSAWTVTFCTDPFGSLIFALYEKVLIRLPPQLSQLHGIAELCVVDVDVFLRCRD